MKEFSDRFIRVFRSFLPAPFTIAVALTAIAFLVAFFSTGKEFSASDRALNLLSDWETGMWKPSLLVFAFQMMLMLVLGNVLALSKPAERVIALVSNSISTSTSRAAFFICLLTMLVGFFNWGFGLIFGAILARKVGENAFASKRQINYPLIGAAGYAALMVWHGGISGSSLIKVAEPGHLAGLMKGVLPIESVVALPNSIGIGETVFSPMNLTASILLLTLVPLTLFLVGKRVTTSNGLPFAKQHSEESEQDVEGAERLDYWKLPALIVGSLMLLMALNRAVMHADTLSFQWVTPNWINLMLFGFGLVFHGSIHSFLKAIEAAIGGASGILIQFPLYFGIMGIITGSGLVNLISEGMVSISTAQTYPLFTFFSAGLVNVFVPSGGGQWAVQGPIIVKASLELGVPLWKSILAMAYGDQLTNMLQPFWALPLLGITGLKAKAILPYTLLMMAIGLVIFITVLLLF